MTPDRFRRFDRSAEYDAIVIGAGLGGLACAAIMAKRGHQVLVLDQHYLAGGNATVFNRPGYEFDIGVHYVGDCEKGGQIPMVLEEAGVSVDFLPMDPDGFDTMVFPDGFRFAYPRGIDAFEARLLATFPDDAKGIKRYCSLVRQMFRLMRADNRPLRLLLTLPRVTTALKYLDKTLKEFLDTCTKNPRLYAVLCGPHMDYAVAPSRVSAPLHCGLIAHYLYTGACYPKGGGQVIADRLSEAIEAKGGKIMLRATVTKILVEDGRAVGVVFHNKHVGEQTVRARAIVSNADLKKTYAELLPAGAAKPKVAERVAGFEMAPGVGVVYIGARRDRLPKDIKNTNLWLFASDDVEADYKAIAAGRFCENPMAYVTFTSLKDPEADIAPEGIVNLQIMTAVPTGFAAWGVTPESFKDGTYRKRPEYLAVKAAFMERMIARAETAVPGLRDAIVYSEVATPLTHQRYTWASEGTPYGIACLPSQFNFNRPEARSEVKGLFLAGGSMRQGHGIVGALMSGRDAAKAAQKVLAGGKKKKSAARQLSRDTFTPVSA
ncbi:MAG: NAD(P)/FAD-dependent oxidoreductase [Deltaproteobacteria bacterium]|nr:NAD(P)/FAD-dependent oxidoreductase [Deltaproteobacteria bacterium]